MTLLHLATVCVVQNNRRFEDCDNLHDGHPFYPAVLSCFK